MAFEAAVREVVERCPGAQAAAIVDADGIPVVAVGGDDRLEELAAQYSTVLREIQRAARELNHGQLRQVQVEAESLGVVLTAISAGYFLILLLQSSAIKGQARFLCRLASQRLYSEFI